MAAKECPNCRLLSPGTASFCSCGWDFTTGAMRAPRPARAPRPTVPVVSEPPAGDSRPEPGTPVLEEQNPYESSAAPPPRAACPALPVRVFAMPFVPSLWSRAAGWRFLQVAVPLTLLALLLQSGLALYRSWGARSALANAARAYQESYPAIFVEGGKVRVADDRVIQFVEGRMTILVDPKETIPLDRIATPEYLVVRADTLIRRQGLRNDVTRIADLQQLFGDPIRIDGPSIRAFSDRWGVLIQVGSWAFIVVFGLVGDVLALVYVLLAAGLALAFRGRAAGRTYGQCLRVTLAVYALVLVLAVALNLIGKSPGFCLGFLLWPLLLTGLATWAVGRQRA